MQPEVRVELAPRQPLKEAYALKRVDVSEELVQGRREGVVVVQRLLDLDGVVVCMPQVAAEWRELIGKLTRQRVLEESVND